jgi:hypothetical protein
VFVAESRNKTYPCLILVVALRCVGFVNHNGDADGVQRQRLAVSIAPN